MIHTISELLKEVSEFKSEFFDEQIYYRGQKNGTKAGWMLLPTFYREKKQYASVPFYSDKKEELNTIYKFIEKNYDYFKNIEFDDLISIINILQHYGFPTRVLDVTQNPLVALYFALEEVEMKDGNEPVIYLVYAEKTSAGYLINSDLKRFYNDEPNGKKRLDSMVLVNGCVLSERIRNQKGDFILYYTDGDIKENKDFVIKEIPISPDSIEDLKRELRLIGISKSTIYPALTEETKKLKDQLKTIASQKALKEKMKVFSKPRQNSGELFSEVLSDKEKIPRKYLDKKKMFAEINLNNNRHGK